ncbi:MAG TPA: hypothetical protein VNW92_24875, partial [Polyangiaceae bacterium]|nr:hypothetical protein [Polyangiaceae bacterium]
MALSDGHLGRRRAVELLSDIVSIRVALSALRCNLASTRHGTACALPRSDTPPTASRAQCLRLTTKSLDRLRIHDMFDAPGIDTLWEVQMTNDIR